MGEKTNEGEKGDVSEPGETTPLHPASIFRVTGSYIPGNETVCVPCGAWPPSG